MSEQGNLYAIIDVETTGGTVGYSRITEISVFLLKNDQVIEEFSTLVNPEIPIPVFITQLTGIDDHMVSSAPSFSEIAARFEEITAGATFVAHNVNFDYGMITSEFRRLGFQYQREKLCTVQLAKRFLPDHRSYGLGRITEDLGIPIHGRHRARGDAEATVKLFQIIYHEAGGNLNLKISPRVKEQLPTQLDHDMLNRLPDGSGLYYLYDSEGSILFIGKAKNIVKSVVQKLKNSSNKKQNILREEVADINFQSIKSDLMTDLILNKELHKYWPKYNQLKKSFWAVTSKVDLFGINHLELIKTERPDHVSFFVSRKEAEMHLRQIILKHNLCPRYCEGGAKLLSESAACICEGVCTGKEAPQAYNNRVNQALISQNIAWSDFIILDKVKSSDEMAFVMVEDNALRGYGMVGEDVTISDYDDFLPYLQEDEHTIHQLSIVHNYLVKNRQHKIIRKAG